MSELLNLLRTRRSIRAFQPKAVEAGQIEILQEALVRAPSSRGRNPWEFVFVTDPELLRQLARAKAHGSEFLEGAPLAVVIAADPDRCDVWIEDCSIAAILLQLTAHSLGLGSCWVQLRLRPHPDGGTAEDFVKKLVGLPENHVAPFIIGLGYPGEKKAGHPRGKLLWKKIHREQFGRPAPP